MTIESVTYIDDLDDNYPAYNDQKKEGDDHIRNIKTALTNSFPNIDGPVTATDTELNYVVGVSSAIQTQLNSLDVRLDAAEVASAYFPKVNANVTATDEELNFVDGVTSSIQNQLNNKVSYYSGSGPLVTSEVAFRNISAYAGNITVTHDGTFGYYPRVPIESYNFIKLDGTGSSANDRTFDFLDGGTIMLPDYAKEFVILFDNSTSPNVDINFQLTLPSGRQFHVAATEAKSAGTYHDHDLNASSLVTDGLHLELTVGATDSVLVKFFWDGYENMIALWSVNFTSTQTPF